MSESVHCGDRGEDIGSILKPIEIQIRLSVIGGDCQSKPQSGEPVRVALEENGPTGAFTGPSGPIPW